MISKIVIIIIIIIIIIGQQLLDKMMVDIKIYSVESSKLLELDITLRDLINLIFVIAASNNCMIIPKKQIPFSRSLNKETCRMDYF